MKKLVRKISCVLLAGVIIASSFVSVQASVQVGVQNEISPLFQTNITATQTTEVSNADEAVINISYAVTSSSVTRVVITTYVEKRSLLVIWNRVDIGETNNEWVDIGGSGYFSVSHSIELPSSGTYRTTSIFEVYSGTTLLDTVEKTSTVEC